MGVSTLGSGCEVSAITSTSEGKDDVSLESGIATGGSGLSGKVALNINRFGGGSRSNSRTTDLSRHSSAARLFICKTMANHKLHPYLARMYTFT